MLHNLDKGDFSLLVGIGALVAVGVVLLAAAYWLGLPEFPLMWQFAKYAMVSGIEIVLGLFLMWLTMARLRMGRNRAYVLTSIPIGVLAFFLRKWLVF
jgi:hypothetical protein